MCFTIEVDQEEDGRWLTEIPELPGVLAYGQTREEAIARVQALALRVLAERLEHGETVNDQPIIFTSGRRWSWQPAYGVQRRGML
jgi:predicted RNase H-like HicB family nuclease